MRRKASTERKVSLNVTIDPSLYDWLFATCTNASELVGTLLEEYKSEAEANK